MSTPQGGIFALGTASHAYLEFDVHEGGKELVTAVSSLRWDNDALRVLCFPSSEPIWRLETPAAARMHARE